VIAKKDANYLKYNLRECNIKKCEKYVTKKKDFKKLLDSQNLADTKYLYYIKIH
jgi:hypothetical protein